MRVATIGPHTGYALPLAASILDEPARSKKAAADLLAGAAVFAVLSSDEPRSTGTTSVDAPVMWLSGDASGRPA